MKTQGSIKTVFALTLLTSISTLNAKTLTATAQGAQYPNTTQVAPSSIVNGDFFITDQGNKGMTGDGDNEITTWSLDFRNNFDGNAKKMRSYLKAKRTLCSAILSLKMHPSSSNSTKADVIGIVGLRSLGTGLLFGKNKSDSGVTQDIQFDLLGYYSAKEINYSLKSYPMGVVHFRYSESALISSASLKLDYRNSSGNCLKGSDNNQKAAKKIGNQFIQSGQARDKLMAGVEKFFIPGDNFVGLKGGFIPGDNFVGVTYDF